MKVEPLWRGQCPNKRPQGAAFPLLPRGTQQEDNHLGTRKQDLTKHRICQHLDLGLPWPLEPGEMITCHFKSHSPRHPVVQQPEWTQPWRTNMGPNGEYFQMAVCAIQPASSTWGGRSPALLFPTSPPLLLPFPFAKGTESYSQPPQTLPSLQAYRALPATPGLQWAF